MTRNDIINNKAKVFECAKAFRRDANDLMTELAKSFNFSWEPQESIPNHVYRHHYNTKGNLGNEWTYYFHGSDCRFDNSKTGQAVEVFYLARPEFGYLNGYYFYNYMLTTERFKYLANWFDNHLNVWDALDILVEEGVLTEVHLAEFNRKEIIAL